jgi:hypothetical protein
MREQNGVKVYDTGEIPDELKDIRLEHLRFPYGLKQVIQSDGAKHWIPGTREDLLASESKRLGRELREIQGNCAMTLPPNCAGSGCPVPAFCAKFVNGSYVYCACQLP